MNLTLKKAMLNPIPSSSELKSGDVLLIRLLDGLDPLIMWGTGSHIGHTAVFIRNKMGNSFMNNRCKSIWKCLLASTIWIYQNTLFKVV